jgi:hypothetical protein
LSSRTSGEFIAKPTSELKDAVSDVKEVVSSLPATPVCEMLPLTCFAFGSEETWFAAALFRSILIMAPSNLNLRLYRRLAGESLT